jgi:hypothetical protein
VAFKGKKVRELSLEKGLDNILKHLSKDEIKEAIGKTRDYIAKCSNPDPDETGTRRNIDHIDSVKLDKACIKKGIEAPMLKAHQYMLEELTSEVSSGDVNRMLIKFTILDAELKKEVLEAQQPESMGGKKITREEREKINDAIKNIEDRILKIKLAVNKKE